MQALQAGMIQVMYGNTTIIKIDTKDTYLQFSGYSRY